MEPARIFALGVFTSYFVLILWLFRIICTSIHCAASLGSSKIKNGAILFTSLTIASFCHTWYYMFRFMEWSFRDYESTKSVHEEKYLDRISSWLMRTQLFEQAWAYVSFGPLNWWWSEQLCLFTAGAWTIFVATKGMSHRIQYLWAYMLLGQVVAISVASNLFYLALIVSQGSEDARDRPSAPKRLWICVLLSIVTIGLSPFTTERTFLPNLLLMHASLMIPLIPFGESQGRGMNLRNLYSLVGVLATFIRIRTVWTAVSFIPPSERSLGGFVRSAWGVLHSHPAQSSIGWDAVWTTISFFVWIALSERRPGLGKSVTVGPVVTALGSVGVVAPLVLRGGANGEVDVKEE